MKTVAKSMIIIATMLLCGSCTKLVYVRPEKITVSGQVTDKDGQPWEGVNVEVLSSTFMGMSIPVGEAQQTDENGHYEIAFTPKKDHTYGITYEVTKDGYFYERSWGVDSFVAEQEHNVVLKKYGE